MEKPTTQERLVKVTFRSSSKKPSIECSFAEYMKKYAKYNGTSVSREYYENLLNNGGIKGDHFDWNTYAKTADWLDVYEAQEAMEDRVREVAEEVKSELNS